MKLTYCKFDFQQQSFWLSQCLDIINSLAKIIIVYVYWFGFLPKLVILWRVNLTRTIIIDIQLFTCESSESASSSGKL